MRSLVAVAVALAFAFVAIAASLSPAVTSACSGSTASLQDGVRSAASVYYARVIGVSHTGPGFHSLRLDVGQVIEGPAPGTVTRVIPNEACVDIRVGQVGVIVLGSIDPFRDGRNDAYIRRRQVTFPHAE